MPFNTRNATDADFDFLFELKKASHYEQVEAVFGWDDAVQYEIHQSEWQEVRPQIIEMDNTAIGSYLVEQREDHLYFGRFHLMPEYQGKGLGSRLLTSVLEMADDAQLPVKLVHLQLNRAGGLYQRFGFTVESEDEHFVYMVRQPMPASQKVA